MDESYAFEPRSARRTARAGGRSLRPILIGAVIAFLLGAVLSVYLAVSLGWLSFNAEPPEAAQQSSAETRGAIELAVDVDPATPSPLPTAAEAQEAVERVEQVAEQQGGIDTRVAAMEQRIARLDLQAQAAAGNASRAESLLIAFAARRAIERGADLGYLADQLALRFGDAQPNAVQAVVGAGEAPVTIDQLLARLRGLAPVLSRAPAGEGFLARVGREISDMFVIRSEETPAPRPQNRLERARLFLDSGRIGAAVAEVRNMPNAQAEEARAWIADAERLARAQEALELLETSAILEPRRLRDRAGQPVEQLSPAG